ncbi:MAG TPA: malate dehydrogenase, partial [Phycisphaerae bacterium]|nr:malate dehydrogenase [Phycisphaerae bacterium]
MTHPKITVVGAGNVGASCALWAAAQDLGDIVLVDIVDGLAAGKALDLQQTAPVMGFAHRITGTTDYDATAGSDLAI